jgi:hypothetical protein
VEPVRQFGRLGIRASGDRYTRRDGRSTLANTGTFASEAATLQELRQLVENNQITEGKEF